MTVTDRYVELNALASNIASHLGAGWTADACEADAWNWMTHIRQNGEKRIYLNIAREPGKLYIAYSRPLDTHDDWKFKEECKGQTTDIKVSLSKAPEQIARDINRRLMPSIEHLENVAAERRQSHNNYQTTMLAMMNSLHAALGQGILPTEEQIKNGQFDIKSNVYRGSTVDVEVHPRFDGEIDIQLTCLPLQAALDVLTFLRVYEGPLHKEVETY